MDRNLSRKFSKARLGRMRDVMAGYVERGEVPGLVTVVSRGGETHVEAMGSLAVGGAPVRRDSIFRISSMSKPITAAAAMILLEECKLRLDDAVDAWMPELADRRVLRAVDGPLADTVPAERPITVRDLLTFRLGYGLLMAPPDAYPILRAAAALGLDSGPPAPAKVPPGDEWLAKFSTLPLMYQPGDRWLYNTGSELLSILIERASGQPFAAFLRARIFEPLGMKDTGFFVPEAQIDRLATSYWPQPDGSLAVYDESRGGQWSRPPAFASGAAGLVSTADDYLAFVRMLLAGGTHGGQRILSRPSIELMTTDHLTPAQKAKSGFTPEDFAAAGYGFGVSVVTRRDHAYTPIGQYGWDGGLGSVWRSDPQEDMITVLLTQRMWSSPQPPPVCRDFWTLAYQAIDD
ncbi:serine hydrolase domain-containing protein [Nannocystis punicea]|uniref:Serine hydrolase n=1 Tax=Nannocystis punicea TaxID=2995304 RepID=A0ABY7GXG9_9BACT|nr:serine hydrolase domain-containing protein [Nannocystis poenicansa]WAS91580.1 serine hydrolase [Nannocystis poenicansa]